MKKPTTLLLAFTMLFFSDNIIAQVGIGTNTPLARLHVADSNVIFSALGNVPATLPDLPVLASGRYFLWHPGRAAVRMGFFRTEDLSAGIGNYSFATGIQTQASGNVTTAMGAFSVASGSYSTAIGDATYARGDRSTAIGSSAYAEGYSSIAMGTSVYATGQYSTAMGLLTTATGEYSTAMGDNTTAQAAYSVVLGRNNLIAGSVDTWVFSDPLLVVGNGSNPVSRSNAFTLLKNGNLTIAGTLTQNSDARLKTNIQPLSMALSKVLALNGYQYNWNTHYADNEEMHTGLLAQEVQKLMPELVREDAGGTLSVNYNGMVPYLIESVKAQQQEIDYLKKEIETLKTLIHAEKK